MQTVSLGTDTSCKLSPEETICMKCQILFYRKNKKNINNLSSAESAQSMVTKLKKNIFLAMPKLVYVGQEFMHAVFTF